MATSAFATALTGRDEIQITVIGRATGRKITHPVWFVEDGDALYLVPVKGSDTEWFKNVLVNPTITLAADGVTWTAEAIPVPDPATVDKVVERLRAKYGAEQVKKYYSKLDVAVKVPLRG
jgi:deazaflavin-dependent oxidoreductase (nitroreductase family)